MINIASSTPNKSSFNIFVKFFFACENRFQDGKLHCKAIKVEFQLKRLTMILMRLWKVCSTRRKVILGGLKVERKGDRWRK